MDSKCSTVKLYASLNDSVIEIIDRDGTCFSKKEFIKKKYEESSNIFITAYSWFSREASKLVEKPEDAEFPYWVFKDLSNLERFPNTSILELEVPVDEVVLFDMYDWNKVLSLEYIAKDDGDDKEFKNLLKQYGIKHDSDIMLTNFYPQLKKKITDSWSKLFEHHNKIKSGDYIGVKVVQAALWQIKKEWIINCNC
ncbi:DUF3841 domain-containing protein [Clostridioides mangenotii]|uniref:DUF3841 domain-containing protein n=1 Tax=Metaclostridioides mangenotii TaxID=1540 RepID=UPI002149F8EB|nr:DUF3841 domain-containing protein [Clostridioides mangenotii]MCR1954524.1 DUF3841 domain-containing protein [Clostridioides mangenotii]